MSNQNKGADRKACPRAEWLIALFWVDLAKVPDEWPVRADDVSSCLKHEAEAMRKVLDGIPCTVPGCEYCGRPMTRGVAGNTHRDAMDQTFELNGRQFRVIVQEQASVHWIPANVNDFTSEQLAQWLEEMSRRLEEMARRVREGAK